MARTEQGHTTEQGKIRWSLARGLDRESYPRAKDQHDRWTPDTAPVENARLLCEALCGAVAERA